MPYNTNFIVNTNGQNMDLGTLLYKWNTNVINIPASGTTLGTNTINYTSPTLIRESDISVTMDGSPLNGDQVYTFGPSIQSKTVLIGPGTGSRGATAFSNDGIVFNQQSGIIFPNNIGSAGICWDGFKWSLSWRSTGPGPGIGFSYNGINWEKVTNLIGVQSNIWRIVYNGSVYVLIIQNAPTAILYSYDGLNWIRTTTPFSSFIYGLAWNGSYWLAGGAGGNTLASSPNGINWTRISPSPVDTFCSDICWMGNKWVVVGATSTLGIISYNSNPSGQGTWTNVGSGLFNNNTVSISLAWNGIILSVTAAGGNTFGYSADGINFTNLGSIIYNGTAPRYHKSLWNGRFFINGYGQSNDQANTYATSYNGKNWVGQGNTIQPFDIGFNARRMNSVTFQRNLTIAGGRGGNTILFSLDGITWTGLGTNITTGVTYGSNTEYNGKIWVMGCPISGSSGNTIAVSNNGVSWAGLGSSIFPDSGNSPYWTGSMWLMGGGLSRNSMAYSYDGYTWIGLGMTIFSNYGMGFAYNNSVYVAVGSGTVNTLAYSYDGINWTGLGNSIFSSVGNSVIWNGSLFVAMGSGSVNSIAYSYNGIDWTGLGLSIFSVGNSVSWNGTLFVAGGQLTNTSAYSYNGINWVGNGNTTLQTTINSVSWNGSLWTFGGVGSRGNTLAYSYNGINLIASASSSFSTGITSVASNYGVKPIPFIQHPTLAFGSGSINTIAYSSDGISWSGLGNTVFSTAGYCGFWSGSFWIAGGQGGNTMAYSYDGIQWTGIPNPITTSVTGITYNGNTWVAVGTGTNTVAYSSNGLSWIGSTLSHFIGGGSAIWNGSVFMITPGTSGNAFYSTTGTSWTQMNSGLSNADGCPASNGYTWTCPIVGSPGLKYINQANPETTAWTNISTSVFTTQGYCVCYNGPIWVAGGVGGNSIAWSNNGINWTGIGTAGTAIFPNGCTTICWNGTRFVGLGGSYIGYSPDGVNWYSSLSSNLFTSSNGVSSNPGIGAFVAPSAMVLDNYGITGNGIYSSQTLEVVSSDPYFQTGFTNVSFNITSNSIY
jgi:hypothetical protein